MSRVHNIIAISPNLELPDKSIYSTLLFSPVQIVNNYCHLLILYITAILFLVFSDLLVLIAFIGFYVFMFLCF